jgi:hypothetical protein
MRASVGKGGRGVAVPVAERGGIVCCSCMAASASSGREGSSAQLARAERTVSGRVLRKMALNKMSLLGGGGVEGPHLGVLGGNGVVVELGVV